MQVRDIEKRADVGGDGVDYAGVKRGEETRTRKRRA